jgi:small subunit ribosomal protein S8
MSMSDPIADMLTRIRNGQQAQKASVSMPSIQSQDCDRQGAEGRRLYRRVLGARRRWQAELDVGAEVLCRSSGHRAYRACQPPGLRVYKGSEKLPDVS